MMETLITAWNDTGKSILTPQKQIETLMNKIDKNPTLKDAWKEFSDIYNIIEGEELVFFVEPGYETEVDVDYVGI